ncbi:MAG: HEPN domain-containing protein [Sedimentisphaerales bacterium]|nr:HEPN domain-containing protein [Sedimentisphaerales bacterium]
MDLPRIHDVDFLLAECHKVTSGQFDHIDLKSLTDFGVSIRYPDDFYIPDLSEMIYYAQVAKQIREIMTGLIKSAR